MKTVERFLPLKQAVGNPQETIKAVFCPECKLRWDRPGIFRRWIPDDGLIFSFLSEHHSTTCSNHDFAAVVTLAK